MFDVRLHKRAVKFLESLDHNSKMRCRQAIDMLAENPFVNRAGCDMKKLSGQKYACRLRAGSCRFIYVVEGGTVYIMEAFRRERGY